MIISEGIALTASSLRALRAAAKLFFQPLWYNRRMYTLSDPIQKVPGVGDKTTKHLSRLGITTIRDLVYFFPRRWEDFSKKTPIDKIRANTTVTVFGKILDIHQRSAFRKRRMKITQ